MEVILPHVIGGASDAIYSSAPHWDEIIEHTELIVAFGGLALKNTQINSGGLARHVARSAQHTAREAGVDFVNVGPVRGDIDSAQGARWIAPRPNTDVALMMGIAHSMIAGGTHDRRFLSECCQGWDELEAYLTGERDGVRRDAAWAAAVCDVEASAIEGLAAEMTARRTLVTVSWSLQRADHGEQPFWMGVALAAMTGSMGRPGGGFGSGYGAIHSVGLQPDRHRITALDQGRNAVTTRMPVARIADVLLEPGREIDYDGRRIAFPDVRLVYWCGGNPFHHHQDLNRLARAWQRPETVIVHESWWNPIARFADIVFPAATALERNDVAAGWSDSWISAMHRAVEPPPEVCTDYETFCALAERLGFRDAFSEGRDADEWVRYFYDSTRESLRGEGVELPPYEEFWDAGRVEMPTPPLRRALDFAALRADPAAAPLPTPSGRIEIGSATIAGFGYDDCPGHPAWMEPAEWLGSDLATRFPLHLISNQPYTRLHSQYDNGDYSQGSKVGGREPIRLHPEDAGTRGIADGDVVRVFNDRGSCLAGAVLDANLRRSVVQLSTGAWWDPVAPGDPGALDRHGNPNVLTLDKGTSRLAQGPSAQTALVEVERHDGQVPAVEAFTPPELLARRP
jgi:biotin/methionine sulfoxide reductase